MKKPLAVTRGINEATQTVIWLCKPIILPRGYFEGPTEVQLNSLEKLDSLWSTNSMKKQDNFI